MPAGLNTPFATNTKTEITCYARGVFFINPSVRTIVDIGGQDSKVICLDETGAVTNLIMNDKYAAGTGQVLTEEHIKDVAFQHTGISAAFFLILFPVQRYDF